MVGRKVKSVSDKTKDTELKGIKKTQSFKRETRQKLVVGENGILLKSKVK